MSKEKTQCVLRFSGCPVRNWQENKIKELYRDMEMQAKLLRERTARIRELEAENLALQNEENNCRAMLMLCGEEDGIRNSETPVVYLRRLIDALIKAQARVEELEGEMLDAAIDRRVEDR